MVNSWPAPKPAGTVAVLIVEGATMFPVFGEMPETRPPAFYVVSVIGGRYDNPAFSEPRVLVEAWATDAALAEDMTVAAMRAFKNAHGATFGGVFVHGAEDLQGPTDYNDPDIQDRRRCQFHGTLLLSTN